MAYNIILPTIVYIQSVLTPTRTAAEASAVLYSISETAKLNSLSTYNCFNHLLTELPKLFDRAVNVINVKALESLLPLAEELLDKSFGMSLVRWKVKVDFIIFLME